jgi:predicted kinase
MVTILIGPIASGKTTHCKKKAKEGWIIICDDDIVNMLHAQDYTLYDKELKPLYKSIEDHILHVAIAMKRNVIIDRGLNISKKARKRWLAICNSLDVPVLALCFERQAPEVHAQRRYESDNRGHDLDYWLEVANRHDSQYEFPVLEEGFSDIIMQDQI